MQYFIYLKNIVTEWDFGTSWYIAFRQPAWDVLLDRLLPTVLVNLYSFILSIPLGRVAQILRRYPDFRIRIEGHADARGTLAYNDALGQKRACNARDYLLSLQVDELQVSCVSFGKERPLAPGDSDADHQLNRRNDIVPAQARERAPR